MNDLSKGQEAALVECLQRLESGASADDCLKRHPGHAEALRPYLELHTRLRTLDAPEPSPAAYAAGRETLLARVAGATSAGRMPVAASGLPAAGWLRSPLARVAAAGLLLFALAGGALGASAAAGVDQARNALSALHIMAPASHGEQPPHGPDTSEPPDKSSGTGGEHNGSIDTQESPGATSNASVPAANLDGECIMLPPTSDIVLHPDKHPDWHVGNGECQTPTPTLSSSVAVTGTPPSPAAATPTEGDRSGRDDSRSATHTPAKDHNANGR